MTCSCINCRTPGFRFHPTDEELINQIRNKIMGIETPGRKIAVVDELGKMEPREIPELTTDSWDDDQICYFFWSPVYKKNGISRTAKNGHWKATGKTRKVKARSTKMVIGQKKTLVFYQDYPGKVSPKTKGSPGKGSPKTKGSPPGKVSPWVIHEYHLAEPDRPQNKGEKNYVLCKLKLKDDGKAENFSPEEAQSNTHFLSAFNGKNEEDQQAHSPANSVTCNPNREESLSIYLPSNFKNDCSSNGEEEEMHNSSDYQISVVADSARKSRLGHHHPEYDNQEYESRSDLPYNVGSHITGDALPDNPIDHSELSAKLGSTEGCAESFGHASLLQLLKHGEATPTCEGPPVSCSFSFDNGVQNEYSTDEIDEHEWELYLADPAEVHIGDGTDQQNVVAGMQCLDTVSPSPQSSIRKRFREEGSGFNNGEPETSRAKVGLQGKTNLTSTVEECLQDLKWPLQSEDQGHDLISFGGFGDEDMGLSIDDLFQ